jgi:hypothetical protein
MKSLFEISDDLMALEEMLALAGGEITEDEAGAALQDWFDTLGGERDTKIDNYAALIRELDARSEAREVEAKRLMALAGADANNAKRLKERLKLFFELHDIKKLDTPRFRISVQANGGKDPLVYPNEWELIPANAPERFHRRVILLDKEALREEAEATEAELARLSDAFAREEIKPQEYNDALHVAEFTNVVRLGERGNHLKIR